MLWYALWSVSVVYCNGNVLKAQSCKRGGYMMTVWQHCSVILRDTVVAAESSDWLSECLWRLTWLWRLGLPELLLFSPPVTSCCTPSQRLLGMFEHWAEVTSALSRLSASLFVRLSTLSLQINNKTNVVTSPKEPVPTPALVHCPPAWLSGREHGCLSLS